MTRALRNPPQLHDPTGYGCSHVATAPGRPVCIAGQYASDETGAVVSADFAAQVERSSASLGTYVVGHDRERPETVLAALHRVWGDSLPAQTLVGVASRRCRRCSSRSTRWPYGPRAAGSAAPGAPAGPR
ncbi:RidA family protein [Streptomyces sp. CMB-StM0423]|uniref:RidA family protein n=1 Tax=Streptomyces sp. CMB-StM0423 TaxID=2059884 RepID=UPI002684FCFE